MFRKIVDSYENNFGKINIDENNNLVTMDWKKIKYKYWISIDSYDKKDNLKSKNEFSWRITKKEDYELLKNLNHYCMDSKYLKTLSKFIVNGTLSKKIKKLYEKIKTKKVKILIFEINMFHKLKISEIIKVNNKKVLYIGAGDTNFQSHFVVGAGLNRFLNLFEKIIHLIPIIKY